MPYRAPLDPINRRLHARLHQKAIEGVDRQEQAAEALDPIAKHYTRAVIAALPQQQQHSIAQQEIRRAALGFWPAVKAEVAKQLRSMAEWSYATSAGIFRDVLPERYFRAIDTLHEAIGGWPPPADNNDDDKRRSDAPQPEQIFPPLSEPAITNMIYAPAGGTSWPDRLQKWSRQFADPDALAKSLSTGLSQGQDLGQLARSVQDQYGVASSTAKRVARSEAHRVNLLAAEEASKPLGDLKIGRMIQCQLDAHTRPWHAIHQGQIYAMDEALPETLEEPNCLLPGSIVQGEFVAGLKAFYAGQAVEIITAANRRFSTTANHPILSEKGFVAAGTLRQGDKLLRHLGRIEPAIVSADCNEQAPALIENVFDAIKSQGCFACIKAARFDFQTDLRFCQGDIEIVGADRKLLLDRQSQFQNLANDSRFRRADMEAACKSRFASSKLSRERVFASASSFPGSAALAFDTSPVVLEQRPLHALRIGPAADHCAAFDKHSSESKHSPAAGATANDPELFGKFVFGLAGHVTTDYIVSIRRFDFCGHVYDLQSLSGWYYSSDIALSNCRCIALDVLRPPEEIKDNPALAKAFAGDIKHEVGDSNYSQWFDQQGEQNRRLAVGTERYNTAREISASAGGKPEWSDFIDPETGGLLSPSDISAETTTERHARKLRVDSLLNKRAADYESVRNLGFLLPQ